MARMEMDYNMDKLVNVRLCIGEQYSTNDRNSFGSTGDGEDGNGYNMDKREPRAKILELKYFYFNQGNIHCVDYSFNKASTQLRGLVTLVLVTLFWSRYFGHGDYCSNLCPAREVSFHLKTSWCMTESPKNASLSVKESHKIV